MDMYQKRKMRKEKSANEHEKSCASMNINWFPGHMAKTIRQIEEDCKLIDVVIELLDARIPMSSQNPEIKRIIKNKKRIVILNKCDLADKNENIKWVNYFNESQNTIALLCNSNTGEGINKIESALNQIMQDEIEKYESKGRKQKIIRAMIVGIPNVGKSSIINKISKKKSMEVGNKPGVTKIKKWIRLSNNIELLDTPGILWPKFENEDQALNLAFTGTIKTDILEESEVAYKLTRLLFENYENNLVEKYKLDIEKIAEIKNDDLEENEKIVKIMELIGKKRGALIRGGEIDLDRTSKIILDDFKNGRLGNITLERV